MKKTDYKKYFPNFETYISETLEMQIFKHL